MCEFPHTPLAKRADFRPNAAMIRPVSHEAPQWRVFAAAWLVVAVLAVALAGYLARLDAQAAAGRQAQTAAALHGAVLRSELERQRTVPSVLARDPDLAGLLTTLEPGRREAVNIKLEQLATEVRAAAIYLLDAGGTAQAASNWRDPTSFVGSNYRFRPYYLDAMAHGEADFFALGTVSGRPGLYLSRRIDDGTGRPIGVIVAKVEFNPLEAAWRNSDEPTYVTDANGVVVITTTPDWRFRTTRPLDENQRRRLAGEQTAGTTLLDLPFAPPVGDMFFRLTDDVRPGRYSHATDTSVGLDWTLHLLWPADEILSRAVGAAMILALLSCALLAGVTGVLLRRRQRAATRAQEAEQARVLLEHEVASRTRDLSTANRRLSREIEERQRLEADREDLENKLVQANKLATLGQIAAGVAHEINQPVAAIRTQTETAGLYLDREDRGAVARSLGVISGMTDRIGAITDELRAFSRKTRSEMVAVDVTHAIEGALLLVSPRLREKGVALDWTPSDPELKVQAERNRLEQVVLNLLQNAIEALDGAPDPRITVTARPERSKVFIRIVDNGPGLAPAVAERLFTPFTTDKAAGLGLGLVISRDIVAGFGGELFHEPGANGATFCIVLARAK